MAQHVVGGLQTQPLPVLVQTIADLGFNCVRLPYSLEMWYQDPLLHAEALSANPALQGMHAVEVFVSSLAATACS